MHIFLIDDDDNVLRSIGRFLRAVGHHVQTACNGLEALRCLEEETPDVVISDIRMPGMDGVALLQEVGERFPDLPVILMTGYQSAETAVAALRERAFDYLKKPIQPEVLLACLERAQGGTGLTENCRA